MKMLRHWLGICGLIIAFVLVGWYGGWWDGLWPGKTTGIIGPKSPAPDIQVARTQLDGWDNGQKIWEIRAGKIWQGNEGGNLNFEEIANGVIFSVKERRVDFRARWARFEKYSNRLFIGGGITARIHEGTLKTSGAVMNFQTGEMVCQQEVRFQGKEAMMKAARITVNFEREELNLEGGGELVQNGDSLRAGGVLYNLKTDEFRLVEPEGVTIRL